MEAIISDILYLVTTKATGNKFKFTLKNMEPQMFTRKAIFTDVTKAVVNTLVYVVKTSVLLQCLEFAQRCDCSLFMD